MTNQDTTNQDSRHAWRSTASAGLTHHAVCLDCGAGLVETVPEGSVGRIAGYGTFVEFLPPAKAQANPLYRGWTRPQDPDNPAPCMPRTHTGTIQATDPITDTQLQAMVDNARAVLLKQRTLLWQGQPAKAKTVEAGAVAVLGAAFEALGQWHRFPPMLTLAAMSGRDPWSERPRITAPKETEPTRHTGPDSLTVDTTLPATFPSAPVPYTKRPPETNAGRFQVRKHRPSTVPGTGWYVWDTLHEGAHCEELTYTAACEAAQRLHAAICEEYGVSPHTLKSSR